MRGGNHCTDEGISVTEAEDGQQALECFLKMPEGYYDAVLMDIMMPVMDGYQAARDGCTPVKTFKCTGTDGYNPKILCW